MQNRKQQELAQMLWLGGSPCSGKTSVATNLAEAYGLRVIHMDKAFEAHRQHITQDEHPMLHKWTTNAWNDLWMQPNQVLLKEAITCYSEQFALIADTLWSKEVEGQVLIEGTSLLPANVAPLLPTTSQGIWMVPTEQFQWEQYRKRGTWVGDILSTCEKPEYAYQNWMQRDNLFGKWVVEETRRLGLACIQVDGKQTIEHNTALVAAHLGLAKPSSAKRSTTQGGHS